MEKNSKSVLVVCDSLRRDLITPEHAPYLSALMARSCQFTAARSVFPSTTRTSSASIATGCQPARHGLLGNTMVLAEADGLRCRSVGHPDFRERLRAATGATLRVPTLAQRVAAHGVAGGALIMSNVSAGAAYFHDPEGHGEVHHRAGSYGPGRAPITGEAALKIESGMAGDALMTQRFCERLLGAEAPAAATLWLSEPDHSGHGHALGSPAHLRGIAHADRCVVQVAQAVKQLRARGADMLLTVASDHGMETVAGVVPVAQRLVEAGLKDSDDSRDVVVAPNGTAFVLGVAAEAAGRIPRIAAWLRAQPWCGAVWHGDALAELGLPLGDPRCAVAATMAHDDSPNPHGVRGQSWIADDPEEHKDYLGCGQHGGLGPFEQSPFLMLDGGGFASARRSAHPASLIDLAPTFLRHLGLPHDGMDGAPLPLDPPPADDPHP